MKARDAEARRLEEDYVARVRAALEGRPETEVGEVVQAVREHIEEESAGLPGEMLTLSAMAGIIERLGPPEAYGEVRGGAAAASQPVAPVVNYAGPVVDYVRRPFDLGTCIGDAMTLYGQNFLPLVLAAVVFSLLSSVTLLILAGPLCGGFALMTLRAIDRADHKVDFGDLFGMFRRFWGLLGLFLIETICVWAGLLMCIVPGLLLATIWFFPMMFMVEKGHGVFESLRLSYVETTRPGRFLTNFLLVVISLALSMGPLAIPYVGVVVSWVIDPLLWLICALAYVRQTRGVASVPVGAMVAV